MADDTLSVVSEDSIDNDGLTPTESTIQWVRSRICLAGFDAMSEDSWSEEYDMTISDFCAAPQSSHLFIYIIKAAVTAPPVSASIGPAQSIHSTISPALRMNHGSVQLTTDSSIDHRKRGRRATLLKSGDTSLLEPTPGPVSHSMSAVTGTTNKSVLQVVFDTTDEPLPRNIENQRVMYFLKDQGTSVIDTQQAWDHIQYGTICGDTLVSLCNTMTRVFVPTILSNRSWPKSLKKDLSEKLHKFMAVLTETVSAEKGNTVLYVPRESGIETLMTASDEVTQQQSLPKESKRNSVSNADEAASEQRSSIIRPNVNSREAAHINLEKLVKEQEREEKETGLTIDTGDTGGDIAQMAVSTKSSQPEISERETVMLDLLKDSELIRRLESTLIHWTRQIEEMVKNQSVSSQQTDEGILEEIEFWRLRTVDLVSVREQLVKPGVQTIVEVLSRAKSTYLQRFETLAGSTNKGSKQADDNLKYLSALKKPCLKLSRSQPSDVPSLLPEIIAIIRAIWNVSDYYKSGDKVTGLLRKVSNQIITVCARAINLEEIYDGNVLQQMTILNDSIQAGISWRNIFDRMVRALRRNSKYKWDANPKEIAMNLKDKTHEISVDPLNKVSVSGGRNVCIDASSVFAQIDAFIQRCKDLQSVCQGQLQFCRKDRELMTLNQLRVALGLSEDTQSEQSEQNDAEEQPNGDKKDSEEDPGIPVEKENPKPAKSFSFGFGRGQSGGLLDETEFLSKPRHQLPAFGGAKGPHIVRNLLEIEDSFEEKMNRLRELPYNLLDVNTTLWHEDYTVYKNAIKDLEIMLSNVLNTAFDGVNDVDNGVNLLQSFLQLSKSENMQGIITKKINLFYSEIVTRDILEVKKEFDTNSSKPPVGPDQPIFGGSALWALTLRRRVDHLMECLDRAALFPESRERTQVIKQATQVREVLNVFIKEKHSEWDAKITAMDNESIDAKLDRPILETAQNRAVTQAGSHAHTLGMDGQNESPNDGKDEKHADAHAHHDPTDRNLVRVLGEGHLVCNFDEDLLKVFREVEVWEKEINLPGFNVPFGARKMCENSEMLRLLREHVMLVVCDFNKIVDKLNAQNTRHLFAEYMKRIEKRLGPGLSKYTWHKKYIKEVFVKRCRLDCNAVLEVIEIFQKHQQTITDTVEQISELQLFDLQRGSAGDRRKKGGASPKELSANSGGPYLISGFKETQTRHLKNCQKLLLESHYATIVENMKDSYQHFVGQPTSVQIEWQKRIIDLDRSLEKSMKTAIRSAFGGLNQAINGHSGGDSMTGISRLNEPSALFRVHLILDESTGKVVFKPSIVELTSMISSLSRSLLNVTQNLPRICDELRGEFGGFSSEKSLFQSLSKQEEITKSYVSIMQGISVVATEINKLVSTWEGNYKSIWDMDKDKFIKRLSTTRMIGGPTSEFGGRGNSLSFANVNSNGVDLFDKHITKYKEKEQDVLHEESTYNVKFIHVDCSDLKNTLVSHCKEWQSRLTSLLKQKAQEELAKVADFFTDSLVEIKKVPKNLTEVSQGFELIEKLNKECEDMPQKFPEIRRMFSTLEKFDIQTSEQDLNSLHKLDEKLMDFKEELKDYAKLLEKKKGEMRRELLEDLEKFQIHLEKLQVEFNESGITSAPMPEDGEPNFEYARSLIAHFTDQIASDKEKIQHLNIGLKIFAIEIPSYQILSDVGVDLKNVLLIWNLIDDWKHQWYEKWKKLPLSELNSEELTQTSNDFLSKIQKLIHKNKRRNNWAVYEAARKTIELFQLQLPLIQDLLNPAMRLRHWLKLRTELSKNNPNAAANFEKLVTAQTKKEKNQNNDNNNDEDESADGIVNLEKIRSWNLHEYSETIGDISAVASKEETIEKALGNIDSVWNEYSLDLQIYKGKYHKIRSTAELIEMLETDQIQLSTMKNSVFYETFSEEINHWITVLSHIFDVTELSNSITKQWVYLENIFMGGSEEIRRQLPTESVLFEQVNKSWCATMTDWSTHKVIKHIVWDHTQRNPATLMQSLSQMHESLERIQHSLNDYLETKRVAFPRFYFLSNDDLLEILGNSKNPQKLQKHMKKLFAGVNSLVLKDPTSFYSKSSSAQSKGGVMPSSGETGTWLALGVMDAKGEEVSFISSVPIKGAVEAWLTNVESAISLALQKCLKSSWGQIASNPKRKLKESWMKESVGQLLILAGQISWSYLCRRALRELKSNPNALKKVHKMWKKYLDFCAVLIRSADSSLTKLQRKKLVSLITIEVHNRDVIEKLVKVQKRRAKMRAALGMDDDTAVSAAAVQNLNEFAFEWTSQLRFEYVKDEGEYGKVYALQTNTRFAYEYEYIGNTEGRLVVTPLTDRCYLTLTTALHLIMGGSPQGPAGTGKTETVKDLGKALGKYVVVFNCSDKLDHLTLANWFSGLAQSGAWGCFDEFNRISIEVLSVVTQQLQSIFSHIRTRDSEFIFEGKKISLNHNFGVFITMNPGYAGRTELPDNLQALFRPVAMMVPDMQMIAEVFLQSDGFIESKVLSHKVTKLYQLMSQQFSKQDHYDFNLRAIISVLRRAGAIFRENKQWSEERVVMKALKDMNLCKLVHADALLFQDLFRDLFPNATSHSDDALGNGSSANEDASGDSRTDHKQRTMMSKDECLKMEIKKACIEMDLQYSEAQTEKIIQLFDAFTTRHGNMIVGDTCGGKSTIWKILHRVLNNLAKSTDPRPAALATVPGCEFNVLNPKAVTMEELYGYFDPSTREWCDGVLSTTLRNVSEDKSQADEDEATADGKQNTAKKSSKKANSKAKSKSVDSNETWQWVILDGPVDTLWIESMNTVLDDNKVLTLINGDRIALPAHVFLLFEVENLSVASPATVSRVGIVYVDAPMLGWRPFFQSWLKQQHIQEVLGSDGSNFVSELFEKRVDKFLEFKRVECQPTLNGIHITDFAQVQSLCRLFECFLNVENGVDKSDKANLNKMIEYWFVFSLIWSIGATVVESDRAKIDTFFRKHSADDQTIQLPPLNTVYDYYVNVAKKDWGFWKGEISEDWKPNPETPFQSILVPTVDTVRNEFVIRALLAHKRPFICTGDTGTGKTVVTQGVLNQLSEEKNIKLTLNFSSATTAKITQDQIDGRLVKHHGHVFVPNGGRDSLIVFVDDLNMPTQDEFGSQAPLELLRQWMEYQFWFNLEKVTAKKIEGMQLACAMAPPGGARSNISARLQSKFNILNFTFPSDSQIQRIFGTILSDKFVRENFETAVRSMIDKVTIATLGLYKNVAKSFLPTPSKSHYLFNLRDMSNVFGGLLRANRTFCDTKEALLKLWLHECLRVFGDRLVNHEDRAQLNHLLNALLIEHFESTDWSSLFGSPAVDSTGVDGPIVHSGPLFTAFHNNSGSEATQVADVDDDEDSDDGTFKVRALKPYTEVMGGLSDLKSIVSEELEQYNSQPNNTGMDLVLFEEAIRHVCHIHRIITGPRGNAVLVGVGGSGRQSLTRLATYIAGYKLIEIQLRKGYGKVDFYEDIKNIFLETGRDLHPTVFLFTDAQLVEPSFLEDINSLLSSGEIPNLFAKDELSGIFDAIRADARRSGISETDDAMYAFFIERARDNLHIVFCMSPIGGLFTESVRMYPSLVNCSTIKWFSEWPRDALSQVAAHFLQKSDVIANVKTFLPEKFRGKSQNNPELDLLVEIIQNIFCEAHMSASKMAKRMAEEVKRHTYITPTSYLGLVQNYISLLALKMGELQSARDKLANGLSKIDEAKVQVASMTVELEKMTVIVTGKQKECEELLVELQAQQKEVDKKKQACELEKAKTAEEAKACEEIEASAQADLDKALPALEAAMQALSQLSKDAVTEVKSYAKPPPIVQTVMSSVMILLGEDTSWASVKKQLTDANFLMRLKEYDKDKISTGLLKKIGKFTKMDEFNPESVRSKSIAAAAMCGWVCAMEVYANVNREVEPKRMKLAKAQADLNAKQQTLRVILDELDKILAQVAELEKSFQASQKEKDDLTAKQNELQEKLARAEALISGLSSEKERWQVSIQTLNDSLQNIAGDCAMASAFLSYCGPFDSEYRRILISEELSRVIEISTLPKSVDFELSKFMCDAIELRNWQICGLPNDSFSMNNGVLVLRTDRCSLMIDPQSQSNRWIKQVFGSKLTVLDNGQNVSDMLVVLEGAVQFGTPVLLENVGEELSAALDPILLRQFIMQGKRRYIKLNDKLIEYNSDFKLFFTTRLSNPHYSPEAFTKLQIVNFTVKPKGLEEQLLAKVVECEQPSLEIEKNKLVMEVADFSRQLVELENSILSLLGSAKGSLLDDNRLVETLQQSKTTSENIKKALKVSKETEKNIDLAREDYRGCARNASMLYFVLSELVSVDPMYQFSLQSYISLFLKSIHDSKKPDIQDESEQSKQKLEKRVSELNEWHRRSVYSNTCRGLFEKHKLMFAFRMCIKQLEMNGAINPAEYDFFLKGASAVSSKSSTTGSEDASSEEEDMQVANVNEEWLDQNSFENVRQLEVACNATFEGLIESLNQNGRPWKVWFQEECPETSRLPGDWDNRLNDFQRMVILRCLRPDRVIFSMKSFISKNIGKFFTQPPSLDLDAVLKDTSPVTPVVFVLSSGSDPSQALFNLAQKHGKVVDSLSLGAGQDEPATVMLSNALRNGHWVYFANCHLSISWMPALEQLIEGFCGSDSANVHADFRLWLSCKPHPSFPISILQRSLKITNEPPMGLKMNLKRLYLNLKPEHFNLSCSALVLSKFKKLLFSLCWFHSVALERRKFGSLGWNIPYSFTDSDFETSRNILALYLQTYSETPWAALRYLIAEVNYGGRVTDANDRRLINTYIDEFFNDKVVSTANYALSELSQYFVPDDGDLHSYVEFIDALPSGSDHPSAFGQHINADMSAHAKTTAEMLDTLLGFQAMSNSNASESSSKNKKEKDTSDEQSHRSLEKAEPAKSMEDTVLELCDALLMQIPELLPTDVSHLSDSPLKVVLIQETERYNKLLTSVHTSLIDLRKAMQGLLAISAKLQEICIAVFNGKVPPSWKSCYPSLKPLSSWMKDLCARIDQLRKWSVEGAPKVFWLSGLTFPTGFLTALLQNSARRRGVAIDALQWEFSVLDNMDDLNGDSVQSAPKEGAYIRGLFLENAGFKDGCLCDAVPMKLSMQMPIIHFKPVEKKKKKSGKGLYECPTYIYPIRTGTRENPSFVCTVDLKTGRVPPEIWTKRGTALLLSLSD